jgi:hypothetical protein
VRSNSLSRERGQQNQRPHTRQSTGAVLFTPGEGTAPVCATPFEKPGDFDGLSTQWKPLRRRIFPSPRMNVENRLRGWHPHFGRAPLWGTGEPGFPQTSGRHPIPTKIHGSCCDLEIRVELHRPNCRTLVRCNPADRARLLLDNGVPAPPPARFVRVADCVDRLQTGHARLPDGWCHV